jgi:pilus assembly protein CpaB
MVRGLAGSKQLSKGGLSPAVVLLSGLLLLCVVTLVAYAFIVVDRPQPVAAAPSASIASELIDVLVPIEKIEVGTALEPSMFRKESRLATALAPNTLKSFEEIRGGYSASYMPAGQPIVAEYVTLKQPVNQIQANIPDGYRAVALSVDNTTSVEGWARPGAKVDVMLAAAVNGQPALSVIIQNAKVLSAGRSTGNQASGEKNAPASTVTIMVTIDEAAKLQLASSSGVLSLALRGDEDTIESEANTTVLVDSLLAVEGPKGPAPITSEGRVVVEGKVFLIINGKLVPEGVANR